jgi:enediyne biosynthesis protein E4
MTVIANALRRNAARAVALVFVLSLFAIARLPELPNAELAAMAAHFKFTRTPLPELANSTFRSVRTVNPSLARISGWISSVGASVALNDLDGDGLPNDVCYVDPRTDQVIVAPVPGTGARYEPFALDPAPFLPYDSTTMAPMGCLPGDLNEDGLIDILVYYWGRTPVAFLRRADSRYQSLSRASYVAREIVPGGERWYTNAATRADLDGDGHIDLIIGNYFPDGARMLDAQASDVEQMQHSMSRAFNGGGKHLLLWAGATTGNEPTVQFEEAKGILDEEVNHGWTLAIAACDLDGDLLPELYFANDFGPDRLLHNLSTPGHLRFALLEGEPTLTTPSSKVLGHDSFKGMGVDCGDLNDDGLPDLFVSNITSQYALEESNFVFLSTGDLDRMKVGIAPYIDKSESLGLSRSGWAWDVKLGDFDNRGALQALQATGFVKGEVNRWPELQELAMGNDELLSNPQNWPRFQPGDDLSGHQHIPFYVQAQNGRYYDLSAQLGIDTPQVSRGIATADVNGDGRLDWAVANQWGPSYFYQNDSPNPGAYLELYLLLPLRPGQTSARAGHPGDDTPGWPAIGAEAGVHLPNGRRLVAQVDGGNGHSGKRSSDFHFGLGQLSSESQLQVDLRWRDPEGRIHEQTLYLTPGSHTILLGY